MIFNDRMMFIHIGKTGGSSCAEYLIHNLAGPAYNCHAEADLEMAPRHIPEITPRTDIKRHCTLAEAATYVHAFDRRALADFEKIVAVIRDPYTLEYSHYNYMKRADVREREKGNPSLLERTSGDFADFVARAGYHRKDTPQEGYFLVDGEIPPNVELVRYERLPQGFVEAVAPFLKSGASFPFPHVNRTGYAGSVDTELTPQVEEAVYRKHRYLFDAGFYPRRHLERGTANATGGP